MAKRKGIGIREQLSLRERLRNFFLNVERAAEIQRCAFIPTAARRSGQRINPNPAPCGGRLKRQGGLLTCQQCGRNAQG